MDPNLQDHTWLKRALADAHASQPRGAKAVIDRREKREATRREGAIDYEVLRLAGQIDFLRYENARLSSELRNARRVREGVALAAGVAFGMVFLWAVLG